MDFVSRSFSFAEGDPTVVIGEVGVNHNGDPELAFRLVEVAIDAGIDIVKFQVFKAEKEISRFAALAPYQRETSPHVSNQVELCKPLELTPTTLRDIKHYCDTRNIGFLCSAFDVDSIDFLIDELNVKSLKIASGEVTNFPLLEYVGRRNVGVILSTGASNLMEVSGAVKTLKRAGCPELVLLHCVSSYPAPHNELNLRAINTLRTEFGLPTGFSDHSMGIEAAVIATALGAVVIEKHFTLDRHMIGPDHLASAEPDELKRMVDSVRLVNSVLGDGVKNLMPCERFNLPLIRRSLVANGNLHKGSFLTREMIEIKRPASGIDPRDLNDVIGRELACNVEDDRPLTWECLVH